MTSNLGSGPLNLMKELVNIRLFMTSTDGATLHFALGPSKGVIFRPSDETESFLYAYRSWLNETKPREIAQKQCTGLYPIPSMCDELIEFIELEYRTAVERLGARESYGEVIAKHLAYVAYMWPRVTLSEDEVRWVKRWAYWSGGVESGWHDGEGYRVNGIMTPYDVDVDQDMVGTHDVGDNYAREKIVSMVKFTGESYERCKAVLEESDMDYNIAMTKLRGDW